MAVQKRRACAHGGWQLFGMSSHVTSTTHIVNRHSRQTYRMQRLQELERGGDSPGPFRPAPPWRPRSRCRAAPGWARCCPTRANGLGRGPGRTAGRGSGFRVRGRRRGGAVRHERVRFQRRRTAGEGGRGGGTGRGDEQLVGGTRGRGRDQKQRQAGGGGGAQQIRTAAAAAAARERATWKHGAGWAGARKQHPACMLTCAARVQPARCCRAGAKRGRARVVVGAGNQGFGVRVGGLGSRVWGLGRQHLEVGQRLAAGLLHLVRRVLRVPQLQRENSTRDKGQTKDRREERGSQRDNGMGSIRGGAASWRRGSSHWAGGGGQARRQQGVVCTGRSARMSYARSSHRRRRTPTHTELVRPV